jgi:hypothetical protein
MNPLDQTLKFNRRQFMTAAGMGLGAVALNSMAASPLLAGGNDLPHHAPKAKRVIYLFQSGAPSQLETFDYKPGLVDIQKTELPDEIRKGQRLTGMTSGQKSFPIAPSKFAFGQHGKSGAWISELLPYTAKIADDMCIIRSMQTEAINHDPAITFCQTGFQLAGRPSMGAWIAYGLGSENRDLPSYLVLVSRGTGRAAGQPLYDRLWGTGFLPGKYQGVKFRSGKEAVLYLENPAGCTTHLRREMLDDIAALNRRKLAKAGDPEIQTRVSQYE